MELKEPAASPDESKRKLLEFLGAGSMGTLFVPPLQGSAQPTQASIEIQSVNGNSKGEYAYPIDSVNLESLRLRLTDANDAPVTVESPTLHLTDRASFAETNIASPLTHTGDGIYTAKGLSTTVFTEFITLAVVHGSGIRAETRLPINVTDHPLKAPIPGWAGSMTEWPVQVDGTEYQAVDLWRIFPTQSSTDAQDGWLILDSNCRLVTDSETRWKAALAATITTTDRQGSPDNIRWYAKQLREIRTAVEIAETLVTVRDTAANLLGGVATSGAGTASQTTVTQASKAIAEDFAQQFLNRLADRLEEEAKARVGLADVRATHKALAEDMILRAANQADTAADRLANRDPSKPWSYTDAQNWWTLWKTAQWNGVYYATLRTNLLPEGDARSQLLAVSKEVFEGATGVPVDDIEEGVTKLTRLITNGEAGYLSETVEQTAEFRTHLNNESKKWREHTSNAHQTAQSEYGQTIPLSPQDDHGGVLCTGDTETRQLEIRKADLTGDGSSDIRVRNQHVFVQFNNTDLDTRHILSACGRGTSQNTPVFAPVETRLVTPNGTRPEMEAAERFTISQDAGQTRAYRVTRRYTYESGMPPLVTDVYVSVASGDRYAIIEVTLQNDGEQPLTIKQPPNTIHAGLHLFEGLRLAGRQDSDPDYRFYLSGQGEAAFQDISKWTTFQGTRWATFFDSSVGVTFGLLTGATQPHMWIEEDGHLDYLVGPVTLASRDSVTYTAMLGIHAGGSKASSTGQQLYRQAHSQMTG